jgi:hypothetical protein
MMKPVFIHVDAAPSPALDYATEVAWVDAGGTGEAHLIRPSAAWKDAMDDLLASRMRPCPPEFSLRHLLVTGEGLGTVAARVRQLLDDPEARVVAPNHHHAEQLLGHLLAEAGLPGTVEIGHVLEAYCEACKPLYGVPAGMDEVSPVVKRCEAAAASIVGDGHGALLAARKLWVTWRLITAEAVTAAYALREVGS